VCDHCLFSTSLSLTLPPPDSGRYHNLLPWMIEHQIHLIMGFPIWRCPSICMNVAVREHHFFLTVKFLDVAVFIILTQLSLQISCRLSFPIVSLKNHPCLLRHADLTKCSYGIREFIKHTFQFIVEIVLHIINFIFCRGMNIQNNDTTPATS
jgi:hypothetical protein